jgi:hypothetical protein
VLTETPKTLSGYGLLIARESAEDPGSHGTREAIPLLEQDNWESWKLQVEMLLTQKELWRYVTLSSTHELKDDEPAQDKKAWAIIGQLVGQQHYPHVLQFRTA